MAVLLEGGIGIHDLDNDTLIGEDFDVDYLIYGYGGNDSLIGNDGNDFIYGGNGNDTIQGSDGNDSIQGGAGSDKMSGGGGIDILSYSSSTVGVLIFLNSSVQGGNTGNDADNDTISGFEKVFGGTGNDTINGSSANETLQGGDGNDRLYGDTGNDSLDGGNGNDTLGGSPFDMQADTLIGGAGNDLIYMGGTSNQSVSAGADDDIIRATSIGVLTSADTVDGGLGTDRLFYIVNDSSTINTSDFSNLSSIEEIEFGGTTASINQFISLDNTPFVNGLKTIYKTWVANTGSQFQLHVNITNNLGVTIIGDDSLASTLTGATQDDYETGNGNDFISDKYHTGIGFDLMVGNAGNDTMNGGSGDNFYLVAINDDTDIILDNQDNVSVGGADKINLDGVTSESDVVFMRPALTNDLQIYSTIGNSFITVRDYFVSNRQIETITGGTHNWTSTDISGLLSSSTLVLGSNTADTLTGGSSNENILGRDGDDVIAGNDGNDGLHGGNGADSLTGGNGADSLYGGVGNDTMAGGAGNDSYTVDSTSDVLSESVGEGTDTVNSSVTWTLGSNFENLTLTGTSGIHGTGNSAANIITGNTGNNTLSGGDGADTMIGGDGIDSMRGGIDDDSLSGDAGNDYLRGEDGNDLLIGGTGLDNLSGAAGNDTLIGGAHRDSSLSGGTGSDVFVFQSLSDSAFATPDVITDFTQGEDKIDLTGLGFTGIHAGAASGTELGFDTLTAGVTTISNTAGTFAITLTGTYTLTGGAGGDFIFSAGPTSGDDSFTGTAGADTIDGLAGNDTILGLDSNDSLTGGSGTDSIDGGLGNDTLNGNADNDTILGGDGIDSMLGGTGDDSLSGDAGNDLLHGGDNNDTLTGGSGLDKLYGEAGNDSLVGGIHNNTLTGGAGVDVMTGGTGVDRFAFLLTSDSGTGSGNRDTITDFVSGTDKLDFSAIATGISVNGSASFDLATTPELIYTAFGADTLVKLDSNGDNVADMEFIFQGTVTIAGGDLV